jgi:DNA-binding CsgD family transcriptional regulator
MHAIRRLPRGNPSAPSARIEVCIVISDPLLSRRVTSLLSGDMHFRLSFDGQGLNVDGGVRAVLPPNMDGDLLRAAIRIVSAGFTIAEVHEPSGFADDSAKPDRPPAGNNPGIALTMRENEVLGFLAHGASNKSIARDLDISIHTAKFHVASLLGKLGARNRSDAAAIAISRGLVLL